MPAITWAALATAALLGSSDFVGGLMSRRLPLVVVLIGAQLTMLLLALLALTLAWPTDPPWGAVLCGIGGGITQAVGVAALFRGLAIGHMGVVAPLSSLAVLVPLGAGMIGGARLDALMWVGVVSALVGAVLASGPRRMAPLEGASQRNASILLALVAALGFGASQLFLAQGSTSHLGVTMATSAMTALTTYCLAAVIVVIRRRRHPSQGGPAFTVRASEIIAVASIGAMNYTANLLFGLAARGGSLAITAVLAALYPLVTAVLARFVLGERLARVQIVGALLIVAGVAILGAADLGTDAMGAPVP